MEMARWERLLRFWQENGLCVFTAMSAESLRGRARNYLISKKLGVQRIKLGPRSYLRGLNSIQMGEDFWAGEGLWLEAITQYNDQRFAPRIVIGNHVRFSHWVHVAATNSVEIGDDVLIGSKVIITDHNHGHYSKAHTSPLIPPSLRPLDDDQKVVIGNRVWLGDGVVVTPGAYIGEGTVVGANSVVRGRIPSFCTAAGSPAKILRTFDFNAQEWKRVERSEVTGSQK